MKIISGNLLHCRQKQGALELEYSPDTALLIDDQGMIQAKDSPTALHQKYPEAQRIDCPGGLLVPGLVDTHIHFPQMDMIGCMSGSLLPWLNTYTFPTEIAFRGRSPAMFTAAHRFVDELLTHGTTLACVYSSSNAEVTDVLFEVFAQRGLRGIIGKTSMDRHAPDALLVPVAEDLAQQEVLLGRWHGHDQRLAVALTPRFAPSCTDPLMHGLAELHAAHPDTYIQTHYAENLGELQWIQQLYPKAEDYLAVYESFNLVGARTILAHSIHVESPARQRLAKNRTIVSHCPTSNLFLGSGLYNWQAMQRDGVRTTLGTDVGAGTSFSLWQTMNEAYKVSALRGEPLRPVDLLGAATVKGAAALGLSNIGTLDPGFQADLQWINPEARPSLARRVQKAQNPEEILAALIHLCDDRCVESVWVKGRKLTLVNP